MCWWRSIHSCTSTRSEGAPRCSPRTSHFQPHHTATPPLRVTLAFQLPISFRPSIITLVPDLRDGLQPHSRTVPPFHPRSLSHTPLNQTHPPTHHQQWPPSPTPPSCAGTSLPRDRHPLPVNRLTSSSPPTIAPPPTPGSSRSLPRAVRPLAAYRLLSTETKQTIEAIINTAPVVLFMKGTPDAPQCGFSKASVQILRLRVWTAEKFAAYNVLGGMRRCGKGERWPAPSRGKGMVLMGVGAVRYEGILPLGRRFRSCM